MIDLIHLFIHLFYSLLYRHNLRFQVCKSGFNLRQTGCHNIGQLLQIFHRQGLHLFRHSHRSHPCDKCLGLLRICKRIVDISRYGNDCQLRRLGQRRLHRAQRPVDLIVCIRYMIILVCFLLRLQSRFGRTQTRQIRLIRRFCSLCLIQRQTCLGQLLCCFRLCFFQIALLFFQLAFGIFQLLLSVFELLCRFLNLILCLSQLIVRLFQYLIVNFFYFGRIQTHFHGLFHTSDRSNARHAILPFKIRFNDLFSKIRNLINILFLVTDCGIHRGHHIHGKLHHIRRTACFRQIQLIELGRNLYHRGIHICIFYKFQCNHTVVFRTDAGNIFHARHGTKRLLHRRCNLAFDFLRTCARICRYDHQIRQAHIRQQVCLHPH